MHASVEGWERKRTHTHTRVNKLKIILVSLDRIGNGIGISWNNVCVWWETKQILLFAQSETSEKHFNNWMLESFVNWISLGCSSSQIWIVSVHTTFAHRFTSGIKTHGMTPATNGNQDIVAQMKNETSNPMEWNTNYYWNECVFFSVSSLVKIIVIWNVPPKTNCNKKTLSFLAGFTFIAQRMNEWSNEERAALEKARNAYNRDKANEEVFKMLNLEFIISLILPENIHHLLFIIRMFATKSFLSTESILVSHHSWTNGQLHSFIVRQLLCHCLEPSVLQRFQMLTTSNSSRFLYFRFFHRFFLNHLF